jgi:hypothetical protein
VDSIDVNAKLGAEFCGDISVTYNTTTESFHWWEAVKNQPKWSVKFGATPNFDMTKRLHVRASGEYSSVLMIQRRSSATWKGKGKASSNNQSENEPLGMRGMFKSLHNVNKTFERTQL